MSKSRLEKFLYALYSLDSSDLPTPLSRIEELYNCWVTGEEAPSFEPISRVEKYLMAILGGYDADSLPNPLSRVEVLLYKLATGDDNLDDVKSFLSEHEELLAEIIRNGGVGGNIDIEYVLYTLSTEHNTLYNTAEKPVKSAILKGQTLINHVHKFEKIMPIGTGLYRTIYAQSLSKPLKPNTNYLFINHSNVGYALNVSVKSNAIGEKKVISSLITSMCKFTTPDNTEDFSNITIYLMTDNEIELTYNTFMIIEYQDGMENWDIPYFEGMQSVKMPVLTTVGKNLFNKATQINNIPYDSVGEFRPTPDTNFYTSDYIELEKNTDYTLSGNGNLQRIFLYGDNKEYKLINGVSNIIITNVSQKTFNSGVYKYARISYPISTVDVQLEKGVQSSSYEPFKSNILTVNEDVELRGIGEVKDELDLLTGEVVQSIYNLQLTGNENWGQSGYTNDDYFVGYTTFTANLSIAASKVICDKLKYNSSVGSSTPTTEGINIIGDCSLRISLSKTKAATLADFINWIRQEQPVINFVAKEKSIKTVDLSVVNQDGNDTKLKTFDDLTHVTLSSEGLIPESELEAATKNEEDLEDSVVYAVHTLSEEFNTLHNTAEKPVKSAILKGQTKIIDELGNECQSINSPKAIIGAYIDTSTGEEVSSTTSFMTTFLKCPKITFVIKGNNKYKRIVYYDENKSYISGVGKGISDNRNIIITSGDIPTNAVYMRISASINESGVSYTPDVNLFIEDENGNNLYITHLESVKMPVLTTTGKQLLNVNDLSNIITTDGTIPTLPTIINAEEGIIRINETSREYYKGYKVKVKPNTDYIGSCFSLSEQDVRCRILNLQGNKLNSGQTDYGSRIYYSFNSGDNDYVVVAFTCHTATKEQAQIALYEGTTRPATYEPFKSNILTVNEDVELRGIGDVQDELNVVTGELTQRIGEVVLDGSENWVNNGNSNDYIAFRLELSDFKKSSKIVSDSIPVITTVNSGFGIFSGNGITVTMLKTVTSDLSNFKTWLSTNPVTIQYQLAESNVKTVDLSVVDQDGNNTELSTFNDITHVTLSSEGLIPEAELEVAEKVPEVAASMLAISREQEVIDTTTNEQSENVDATMIATTEIYEELL